MEISQDIKDKLIFALDVPNREEAVRYIRLLDGWVGCFKVGLELFVKEGPDVLKAISDNSSAGIFLDLKLHDIPATVRGALNSASAHGARFITIHSAGGPAMMETADEISSTGLEVLAVTILTSTSQKELPPLGFSKETVIRQLVLDRAWLAKEACCAGVVCSGEEVEAVKKRCGPEFKAVIPGIRPAWSVVEGDDQSRIVTPGEAIAKGADHIVVGRPIRTAKDPREAAQKILGEIAAQITPH